MLEPSERLRSAIVEGNLSITKRMLFRFPELWLNVNYRTGWNNLHYSSFNGNYLICFHLISFINQFKDENDELLNVYTNHNDMLTFDKLSPLHLAIKKYHLQTLHYLLQEFPGVYWLNHKGGVECQTPLHYCCKFGFNEGLKLLLEKGADYSLLDNGGNNLLHLSFEYGNFECIKIFIKFLYDMPSNKRLAIKLIKQFENCKNNKGWLPIELGLNFKLTNNYKNFKKSLIDASRYSSSVTAAIKSDDDIPSSNTDEDDKLVMMMNLHMNLSTSSIERTSSVNSFNTINQQIAMADGADKIDISGISSKSFYINSNSGSNSKPNSVTNLSNPNSQPTSKSSHSKPTTNSPSPNKILSSPIMSVNEQFQKRSHSQSLPTQEEKDIPLFVKRDRANTALEQQQGILPSTPVIKKTPSLKSITISPSVRLNTDSQHNLNVEGNVFTAPQVQNLPNSTSNSTSTPTPTSTSTSTSATTSTTGANIHHQFNQFTRSDSNSTINSTSTSTSTTNSSPKQNFPLIKSTSNSNKERNRSYSIEEQVDSPSSIAAKIAFGSSKSSLKSSPRNSRSGSNQNSKQNSTTSLQNGGGLNSSPPKSVNSAISSDRPDTSPSKPSANHRNTINTISFSRIR